MKTKEIISLQYRESEDVKLFRTIRAYVLVYNRNNHMAPVTARHVIRGFLLSELPKATKRLLKKSVEK